MRKVEPNGNNAAVRRHAVQRRAHGVLAHAEMYIAPGVIPRPARRSLIIGKLPVGAFKIAHLRQHRERRRI